MLRLLVLSLAFAGLLAASAAIAQDQTSPATPGSQENSGSPGNTALSDRTLDAAAAAIARVSFLRENYQRQLAQADPADRQKIAEQASGELAKAVNDQGLSVQEYNTIVDRARTDPDVRKKILDRLEPPTGERPTTGAPSSPPQ